MILFDGSGLWKPGSWRAAGLSSTLGADRKLPAGAWMTGVLGVWTPEDFGGARGREEDSRIFRDCRPCH